MVITHHSCLLRAAFLPVAALPSACYLLYVTVEGDGTNGNPVMRLFLSRPKKKD